jgi:iron complex outermembrane receptor protein
MVSILASLMVASATLTPAPEVIIVTATPLGDKSDALSQGVAIISGSDVAIASLSGGIGETLAGVPGIRATFYGPNASRPIIRGLGEDRIRLLLNGLAGIDASTISPDHAPAIDGLDAERIEVLKGPAALRFGSNAIGGVVNVVDGRLPLALPDRPISGDLFVGHSSAEVSNAGAVRLTGTSGRLVVRFDVLARSSDDYAIPGFAQTSALRAQTKDKTRGKVLNSRGEIWAIGASAARISQRTNVALSLRQTQSNYGIPGEDAFIDLKQTRLDGHAILKDIGIIDTLTFAGTTGDYTHAEIEASGEIGTVFDTSGHEGRIEARLKPFGDFEALLGVQFGTNDVSAEGEEAFLLPVTVDQFGVFGFQRYSGSAWGGEIGGRYESRNYSGLAGARDFDLSSVSASVFGSPLKGLRLSLNLASTQRAPTEVELFADGSHAATQAFERGDRALRKEIATSVEGGVTWRVLGWTVQLDVWRAQFDGFIGFAPTGEIEDDLPVFEVIQKDGILSGYELGMRGPIWSRPGLALSGDIALDYVRGRYDEGDNIARMPPSLLTLGVEAQARQIKARGEVLILSDQNKIAAFEHSTSGAITYNVRFGWKPLAGNDDLELTLEGRNLSDEDIREHTSFLKDQLPKPGRSVRVSLHARF